MKSLIKALFIFFLASIFSGCASSGPTFSEMTDDIIKPTSDAGRIYIYRTTALGAAVQPKVFVNDEVVGKAVPKGFIYLDREPGNYEIKTSTEVKRTLSLTLEGGQIRFVRLNISMGFFVGHVYPELVENSTGEKEIQDLHYLGQSIAQQ